ncbi:putative metal-dependent HD superfamily phosphohydrolase [Acinetobacter calcoaceticus]|uniref:Putative metal-dependent HD superfamily phosphohydrolase n=1 Tax=Acinetobacter calcoaceticus TaxID=471 RepID=A0A4R1XBS5_ACICA|nr:putative metal-dependent HD superfamily phosphohydrolase [Acinetobacter calcoaceticus]
MKISIQQQFEHYWLQFQQHYQLDAVHGQVVYAGLVQAYSETQRAYHSMQHIVECLDLLAQVLDQLEDPFAVQLAIWFHDAVYDPQATDNEQQSAVLMQQQCQPWLSPQQSQKIAAWIEATQHHQPSKDNDLNYLLDIDLAILGSSASRFAEYELQIREEYSWVAAEVYAQKRAAVLQHFYQMQPLYQTEYFSTQLEQRAKANLSPSP